MKNGITELVFILDRSGSMSGLEADTIGGFNSMLEKQKQEPGACWVNTVLFDHETQVLHDRVPLAQVQPITDREYYVRGSTALLDAVGGAIDHIASIHRYARPEDVPEHTVFVITTDGYENASRRYSAQKVKEMIRRRKEKDGWEFLFLGANIDAVAAAGSIGIDESRAANFVNDAKGTRLNYAVVSDAVGSVRRRAGVPGNWKEEVDRDYRDRRKK
ncbi:MAG: VWA domain-containing protein [Oscillospiraceae bacterium]|nr:VWA domain-containing protein [Oscillospiraceae bacterium]